MICQASSLKVIRLLVVGLLVGLTVVGLPSPVHASDTPDFDLRDFFRHDQVGFLVRGDVIRAQPIYLRDDVFPGFGFPCQDQNFIQVRPVGGFQGVVGIEILNLPAGITSLTDPSVTTLNGSFPIAGIRLQATLGAALGEATITVKATSGAITHTVDTRISIVDELPPCPLQAGDPLGNLTVGEVPGPDQFIVGGGSARRALLRLIEPAPVGGTVVSVWSDDPTVMVPASVTVPEGHHDERFTISALAVTEPVTVTLFANVGAELRTFSVTVVPPSAVDAVVIKKAEYNASTGTLMVEATSGSCLSTLLTVHGPNDLEKIGSLVGSVGRFEAELDWPVFPQTITVLSHVGGEAVDFPVDLK